MGRPAFGSASVAIGPSSISAATIADREREGGGAVSQRRAPDDDTAGLAPELRVSNVSVLSHDRRGCNEPMRSAKAATGNAHDATTQQEGTP
jgi:hypothetical protein